MWAYFNHQFVKEEKALVSVNNRSFRYGDGCFETMKVVDEKLMMPSLHMHRLFDALRTLRFECPAIFTPEYLTDKVAQLIAKNGHTKLARVRLTIFRGDGGLYDDINKGPQLLIQSWPLNEANNRLNENGLLIDIYKEGFKSCDPFSNIKSNNFLLYAMAAMYAKRERLNDALVLNNHGRIADATIANLWIVEDETFISPPLTEAPVNGTMRKFLLKQAAEAGFICKEEAIAPNRLLQAKEVMLTNAIYGIRWVKQCGNTAYTHHFSHQLHRQLLAPLWM